MNGRIFFAFIFFIFTFGGCSALQKPPPTTSAPQTTSRQSHPPVKIRQPQEAARGLQNIVDDQLQDYVALNGVIFAKIIFEGVLEKTYVKLLFEDTGNPENKFQLYIGDPSGQQGLSWDVKPVRPGYVFLELPAGVYKISTISIPVGTTQATEESGITFEVVPGAIVYAGTLQVIGTKEKIKLGGVPVIRPGFEYTAFVLDEQQEGIQTFRQRYPNFPNEITVKLMQLNNG